MTERKKSDSFHMNTVYKLVELFLLCFLNGNSIKRKNLENYLVKGDDNRRIGFKDVYIPLIKKFDLPIEEKALTDSSRGRYNPVIWEINQSRLLDEFLKEYYAYLFENDLTIDVPKEIIQNRLEVVISNFQKYWGQEIDLLLEYSINFPLPIATLIMQSALLDQNNLKLIKFLPIFLSLSHEHGTLESSSDKQSQEEINWIKSISQVPSYLDMLTFYNSILINEWTKTWPSQFGISPEELLTKSKQKIFIDHLDKLYITFKDHINQNKPINFLFSPGVPRDESLWYLFFGFKESYLKNLTKDNNKSISEFVRTLQNENKKDYDERVDLFFKIVFNSLLAIFSPEFSIDLYNFVFLGQEDINIDRKIFFSLKNKNKE
ncbi:MAG: hypothetical protein ACW981_13100 [Candidatus Hodarchaeales archaeon]